MIGLAARRRRPDTAAPYRDFLILADSNTGLPGMSRALPGGRQTLRHDTLRVWRDTPSDTPPDDPRMALGPAWDLPVLYDAMHDVATQVLARAKTGADSARTLTLWVARQVVTDTESTASGTAIGTLRIHHGSPDAKARLLVTLARTKLIPARVVTGLAVLPQGVFAHSWAELWLGRWIAADPTYGDFPASAALVRIAVGGRSRPVDLLPLVGSARFLPLRTPR
jgi:transglutaminase-like putative cysteine protease